MPYVPLPDAMREVQELRARTQAVLRRLDNAPLGSMTVAEFSTIQYATMRPDTTSRDLVESLEQLADKAGV